MFWLTKLKKLGQSEAVTKQWLDLISSAGDFGMRKDKLSQILATKMVNVVNSSNKSLNNHDRNRNHILEDEPILSASKFGSLEVLKLLLAVDSSIMDKRIGNVFPIFPALYNKHFEAVKFILKNMKTPLLNIEIHKEDNFGIPTTLLSASITLGTSEFVKFMVELHKSCHKDIELVSHGDTPIHVGIDSEVEILKYLTTQFDVYYCEKSRPHAYRESALRRALRFAKVDAVKILAPLSKELKLSDITRQAANTRKHYVKSFWKKRKGEEC